jgi:hypothetical protein
MIAAREALRAKYDAVIEEINASRGSQQLSNAFYSKIGDAIFEACYSALENFEAAKRGIKVAKALQVVSAPIGAGKTTFTLAFITALVRLRESRPDMPCGSVFLVEQMTKADEMYRELSALLPGKVAVWSRSRARCCSYATVMVNDAGRSRAGCWSCGRHMGTSTSSRRPKGGPVVRPWMEGRLPHSLYGTLKPPRIQ